MQPPKQVKGNLGGDKGVDGAADGDPEGAEDEDEALAVNVGDAAPEEEEAAKGEDVGRDDPLLARVGDVEGLADLREDDDDALAGEGLKKYYLSMI